MTIQYKPGDLVTIRLDEYNAKALSSQYFSGEVLSHVPAPEPIVGWVNVYSKKVGYSTFGSVCESRVQPVRDCLTTIKLTYNHATNEAKAEVVS